jgi:response regulator of citrate/malate metabolism
MDFSPKKVLIVEDDHLLTLVEKRLIQKMHHQVIATINEGKEALKFIQENQPDIMLMDVHIKGEWNGIETVQEIRKQYPLPVIYFSGSSDVESRKWAEKIGYAGFLIKPVQREELEVAFARAFEGENVIQ